MLNLKMRLPGISPIILHILAWVIFLSLPMLFLLRRDGNNFDFRPLLIFDLLIFFSTYAFVFYFNTYYLIPRLFNRRWYILYFVSVGLIMIIVGFIKPFDRLVSHQIEPLFFSYQKGPPQKDTLRPPSQDMPIGPSQGPGSPLELRLPGRIDIVSIYIYITVILFSMATKVSQQLLKTEQRMVRAEADKAQAELYFLKAQINPHFLFNTLNNLYTLAVKKSDVTAESIMKLSNIMRYVTDELDSDFVSLESEVNCIIDYIDLQRLRVSKNTIINFNVSGVLEQISIAPLILMTFIENAFKFGISNREVSAITIRIAAENKIIEFFCENALFPSRDMPFRPGIGINNAKQRLDYLYHNRYILTTAVNNGKYVVQLTLKY
jgi:two-component system, LytTR family, sensor kinase